jgi:hypothetical protein
MYLFIVFAVGIMGEFQCLRPDLFNTLFFLLFIYSCLEIPGGRMLPLFFAGASFGLAASFISKQYLLFFLPVLLIFMGKSTRRLTKISIYLLGVCSGVLPLLLYVIDNHIVRQFIFWVFNYNQKRIVLSADFPVAIGAVGAWGAYVLLRRYWVSREAGSLVLFAAFCLSTLSSLTHTLSPFYSYNIELWFMLSAVIGSGLSLQSLTASLSSLRGRSLATGLFLSLILAPNIAVLTDHKGTYFNDDKKIISQLIKYCSQDSCLVILPYHPVFAYDTSRLYSFWQFVLIDQYQELGDQIKNKDIAQEVMRIKPAVVLSSVSGMNFLLELSRKALISRTDYSDLTAFFRAGYTIKDIGTKKYYIRNDKL